MTVGELMQELAKYPAETRVVVNGYEDGYCDPLFEDNLPLWDTGTKRWWEGRYKGQETPTSPSTPPDFVAVVLRR
jgi:hypothetical protein